MTIDWGAPAAWRHHSPEFGALVPFDDGRPIVAMEYRPKASPRWQRMREVWLDLPPHPHILDALEPVGDDGVLLRYAALAWDFERIVDSGDHFSRRRLASWCAQIIDVFEFLREHAHEDFLSFEGESDRASAIYDALSLAPEPHRRKALVGKASLLLDLCLLESALALFEQVCAEAPRDLDASEGRAHALERLGRLGEAAAEYRRFVGLANARADLRVRAAQQWLDAHAL